ncbi:Protein GLUTAMINE DUMPER 4 [Capsicum annuum]|uniref:protein GLUTAMINE DUMPER 1 n=1 Tax=Capsicum annuum TaxID=4072 RepID=UPI001FB110C6|nr:protein GLUTAMINE DUMPER 1 [Capsicum annuum]KAF3643377.1 Protein GLUTAMINE DUMPER 4 [Capsicum annuum]
MRSISTFTASSPSTSPSTIIQKSPWHSPAPYLFAGVAAMLVLITFALVILACSYWKRSGYPTRESTDTESAGAAGEEYAEDVLKSEKIFEERVVVIMAGDLNPSFLATPSCSRGSSFGVGDKIEKKLEESEKVDDEKMQEQVSSVH